MCNEYNIEVLISTVDEALTEEQEWQLFIKTWKPGYISDMNPEKVYQYYHREGRMNSARNAVQVACRLLNIDQDVVVGVVKSMNRYQRHHRRWDRTAHVTNEKSFRCFVTSDIEERYEAQAVEERAAMEDAKNIFINGGTIKDAKLIVKIADKYDISIPIRTRGWILNSLSECTITEDGSVSYHYWKTKGAKGSQTVYKILFDIRKALKALASA